MKDYSKEIENIRKLYGEWTAHNIEIDTGLFTMNECFVDRASRRAETYIAFIKRFHSKRIRGLRILDLGCLEGGISIALAKSGCKCIGVDVREQHLVKAKFAAESLRLTSRCKWKKGDVTKASLWKDLGKFDVIICSGLLYHIDASDIIPLLRNIRMACKTNALCIIDTNISSKAISSFTYEGNTFWGCPWKEHNPTDGKDKRIASSWSSYENNQAFWLTERSLTNALLVSDFDTIFKPLSPFHEWNHQSRDIWLAYPAYGEKSLHALRSEPDMRPIDHPDLSCMS